MSSNYIALGKIGAPWGLKGEAKLQLYNPDSLVLKKTRLVYFKAGLSFQGLASPPPSLSLDEVAPFLGQRLSPDSVNTFVACKICTFRKQGSHFVLGLEGFSSPESIKQVLGEEIYVPLQLLSEKKKGELFVHELMGMQVLDEEGQLIGEVKALENYGSTDLLIVAAQDSEKSKDYMIPWIPDVIVNVDEKNKKIVIRRIEGLLDL